MPIRKKNTMRNRMIVWTAIAILVILMIISLPPAQHVTEIVLF